MELQKKQEEKLQKVVGIYNIILMKVHDSNYENGIFQRKLMKFIHEQMIEEEEIRMLRKDMVPRAQLMPYFDKPFLPQR